MQQLYRYQMTFDAPWNAERARMAMRDINVDLRGRGAVNIEVVEQADAEPKRPQVLHLGCTKCKGDNAEYSGWFAEAMQACPMHGRKAVVRLETGRVDLPEGRTLGFKAA